MEPSSNQVQPGPAAAPVPAQNYNQPAGNDDYPVQVKIGYPEHQSRLLALFSLPFLFIRYLLLIPHFIIICILSLLLMVVAWINFWAILFTGHSSKGLHSFMVGVTRWTTRLSSYMYGLTDKYPPFSLD